MKGREGGQKGMRERRPWREREREWNACRRGHVKKEGRKEGSG